MKKYYFVFGGVFFASFLGLTLGLLLDINSLNKWDNYIFNSTGYNPIWYEITEILGWIPLVVAFCFGVLGLWQWTQRKSLKKVDKDLLCLAGLYGAAALVYAVFEFFAVNYRPVLIDGVLEASYPSSHTVLVCVIMISAALQLEVRFKKTGLRRAGQVFCILIALLVTVGRLFAGVHWLTDILGGLLISFALIFFYQGAVNRFNADK